MKKNEEEWKRTQCEEANEFKEEEESQKVNYNEVNNPRHPMTTTQEQAQQQQWLSRRAITKIGGHSSIKRENLWQ